MSTPRVGWPTSSTSGSRSISRASTIFCWLPPEKLSVFSRQSGGRMSYCVRSEEHTSELQSLMRISYAVFCLKKKKHVNKDNHFIQSDRERHYIISVDTRYTTTHHTI